MSDLPVHLQLLIRSRTGNLAPSHRGELPSAVVVDASVDELALGGLLDLVWDGEAAERDRTQGATPATPFANTVAGCSWYQVWHPGWEERPFVVVAGVAADDFALALALDRCYSAAGWWPTTLEGEMERTALRTLSRTLYDVAHHGDRRLLLTSTSLTEAELLPLVEALALEAWGAGLSIDVVDPLAIPLLPAQRLFERHRFGVEEHVLPFVDDVLASQLPPVIPTGPDTPPPESLTWQIDADVDGFRAPARWCMREAIQDSPRWPEANIRAGTEGPSYMSTRMGFVVSGSTIAQKVRGLDFAFQAERRCSSSSRVPPDSGQLLHLPGATPEEWSNSSVASKSAPRRSAITWYAPC